MIRAAGILLQSPEGRILMLKRAPDAGDHAGEWCFPGGTVEGDETTDAAACRECEEETGHKPDSAGSVLMTRLSKEDDVHFTTYHKKVDEEFVPKLNGEHVAHAWISRDDALGEYVQ